MSCPACPFCRRPAVLVRRTIRYRRGERVLPVEVQQWQCGSGCEGPDGEAPFTFADPATLERNDAAARAAWREKFGEPMPPSGRPGRPTARPRTERLQVRLTPEEMVSLDRVARSHGMSRSEVVRVGIRLLALAPQFDVERSLRRRRARPHRRPPHEHRKGRLSLPPIELGR